MKAIIRKNGQKIVVTDALYESIRKNGLMEDVTASPVNNQQQLGQQQAPQQTQQQTQQTKSNNLPSENDINEDELLNVMNSIKDKIADNIIAFGESNAAKAYGDEREIITDFGNLIKKAKYESNDVDADILTQQLKGKNKNDKLAVIKAEVMKGVKENLSSVLKNPSTSTRFTNNNIGKKMYSDIIYAAETGDAPPETEDVAPLDKIKEEINNRINMVIRDIGLQNSLMQEFNDMCVEQIKSMDLEKVNYKAINIGRDVISDIFIKSKIDDLINKISEDIANAYGPDASYDELLDNKSKNKKYSKLDELIDKNLFKYVKDELTNPQFINATIQKSKEIPSEWIEKTFFPNLINIMKDIIMGDRNSKYKKRAINIQSDKNEKVVNTDDEKWEKVINELSEEKGINDLDSFILQYLKSLGTMISLYEEKITKDSNNSDWCDKRKDDFYELYNIYRDTCYDRAMQINENIRLNKNFIQKMEDIYNEISKKEKIDINDYNSAIEFLKEVMKRFTYLKGYNLKEDANVNKTDDKNKLTMYYNLLKCLNILNKDVMYAVKPYRGFSDVMKGKVSEENVTQDIIEKSLGYINKFFNDNNLTNLYVIFSVLTTILQKYEDYLENKDINLDTDLYKDNDEMITFYNLMGRYPNRSDIEGYRDTLENLNSKIKKLGITMNDFRDIISQSGYTNWDIIFSKSKNIPWKVVNSIVGTSLQKSSDFIVKCLAYKELGILAKKYDNQYKDDLKDIEDKGLSEKERNAILSGYMIASEIVGNTGDSITEEKIASLFYNIVCLRTNPYSIMSLFREKGQFSKKYTFDISYINNKMYTSQPMVLTDKEDGLFAGCITFTKYESLSKLFSGAGSFVDMLKSIAKGFMRTQGSKHWMK